MEADFNPEKHHQQSPPPLPPQEPPPLPQSAQPEQPTATTPPPFPSGADPAQQPNPPARAEAEFVEAERMDASDVGAEPPGGARSRVVGITVSGSGRPPRLWAWLLLIAAWLFLSSSVPFTVFIGVPLNLAALVFAFVCLARGGFFTGITVGFLGTGGSLFVYIFGLARFFADWLLKAFAAGS